jgi:hypothetical protein
MSSILPSGSDCLPSSCIGHSFWSSRSCRSWRGARAGRRLYPAFEWLSNRLGDRPKLAATIVTAVCLAIIIGPVAWLGVGLIDSLMEISEQFGNGGS